MRKGTAWFVFGVATLLLAVLFFWPLGRCWRAGSGWTGIHAALSAGGLRESDLRRGLLNSLKIALGTTALAMAVALPLAWIANQFEFRARRRFRRWCWCR